MSVATWWRILATAFTAAMLVALLAARSSAQSIPLRLVQGSDGSLYLVHGGSRWLIVPDQASDEELAALPLAGEIDGMIPEQIVASIGEPDLMPPAAAEDDVAAPAAIPAPVSGDPSPAKAGTAVPAASPTASGARTRTLPTPLPAGTPQPTPVGARK